MDFIVWLLFSREKTPGQRPQHLLCDGFRKKPGPTAQGAPTSIQGIYSLYLNERVVAIKREPWPQLLALLGKAGESMMIDLLLESSIFLRVDAGQGNYYQLSGESLNLSSFSLFSSTFWAAYLNAGQDRLSSSARLCPLRLCHGLGQQTGTRYPSKGSPQISSL